MDRTHLRSVGAKAIVELYGMLPATCLSWPDYEQGCPAGGSYTLEYGYLLPNSDHIENVTISQATKVLLDAPPEP